jgi:dTDP-4-amino-4,6-dideoxygalactose transaminase
MPITKADAGPVPFVDLRPQNEEIRTDLEATFSRILDNSSFVGGPIVQSFEESFARFCDADHAVGVSSGTDALRIAYQAVGVGAGDAIITVSHTFIATAEAATQYGALPLLVDIDADSQTMSPAAVERLLTDDCEQAGDGTVIHRATGRRVAALVPVHLYGQSADMAPLLELAEAHGLTVVEDAAQAHGATYRFPDGTERTCGSMGDVAAFSFYPGKNLGAIGEAGALVTNDEAAATLAGKLRDHGQAEKYVHETAIGSNARLDALQAATLELKLGRLPEWNEARRRIARVYDEHFDGASSFRPPRAMDYARHVYHLYVIRVPDRDRVRAALGEDGISTGLHYPIPIHLQSAYRELGLGRGSLPVTEEAADQCLSLPMFPHMTEEQAAFVAERVLDVAGG